MADATAPAVGEPKGDKDQRSTSDCNDEDQGLLGALGLECGGEGGWYARRKGRGLCRLWRQ